MGHRHGTPGRETGVAESSVRRIWFGYGSLTRAEKDSTGVLLHDTIRIYGEVSVLSLPALFAVMSATPVDAAWLDPKATGLVAWLTMTVVGVLVRGGWIRPLATSVGWVRLSPTLLVLRLLYFNLTVAVATFGGIAIGTAVGLGPVSVLWSSGFTTLAILLFPRTTDEWVARVRG